MYTNFQDNSNFGYALKKKINTNNYDNTFIHHKNKKNIQYEVESDLFLKTTKEYKNEKYILKIFGGSTSFCNQVDQSESYFENAFNKISNELNFFYKNYSIPGHDILHDYHKLKNIAVSSFPVSESIFLFNYGWNEEFINSVYRNAINNNRPLNSIETNFIYCKNNLLSFLSKNYFLAKFIKKSTNKKFVKLMDFHGINRWVNFTDKNYYNYWINNFSKISKLIVGKKSIIFNNPGLACLSDTNDEIKYIISKTRLNSSYHLYQALCLEINTIVNYNISNFYKIPIIDISSIFKKIDAKKRLEFFIDEIHLSSKGHQFLSNILIDEISKIDLNKIPKLQSTDMNVLKKQVEKDIKPFLDVAKREIFKNYNSKAPGSTVPSDRYPSYQFK